MRRQLKTRRFAMAVIGVSLVLAMSGCTDSGSGPSTDAQKQAQVRLTESERSRLKSEFAAMEHVIRVSVTYGDVWPQRGDVGVYMDLPAAYAPRTDAYNEAVTKAVWLSRINPLQSILVSISFDDGANHSRIMPLLGKQGVPELTQRFGPRPTT